MTPRFGRIENLIPPGQDTGRNEPLSLEQIQLILKQIGLGELSPEHQVLLDRSTSHVEEIISGLEKGKKEALQTFGQQLTGRLINFLEVIKQTAPSAIRARILSVPVIDLGSRWEDEHFVLLTRESRIALAKQRKGWKKAFGSLQVLGNQEVQFKDWDNIYKPNLALFKLIELFPKDENDIIRDGYIHE